MLTMFFAALALSSSFVFGNPGQSLPGEKPTQVENEKVEVTENVIDEGEPTKG